MKEKNAQSNKKEKDSKTKDNKNNNNDKKEEIKENKGNEEQTKNINKRPSAWIFLEGNDLQGFHITFILMIVIPISTFFIIRNILDRFNFSKNQQNVYGVIGVIISVYMILITYIIYYFRNDFKAFFFPKKGKEKKE